MRLFSYRWHPARSIRTLIIRANPMTLVTFELEDAAGGTKADHYRVGF